MQLSKFSDYSFRALMYLALSRNRICNIEEMAKDLDISEHHLKKIINRLAKTDFVTSIKGRNGGIRLGLPPEKINLGDVLDITEDNTNIVECFKDDNSCPYFCNNCKLKSIVNTARINFFNEFKKYTLADAL
ncbi:MAG: RrF2 family transcriptional regulator [Clostridium sp.]|uniref:RrF2 family transcriptional regulator n=1 Tax=Clostridium sp. TaxID=1506 RepID=UPI003EE53BEA